MRREHVRDPQGGFHRHPRFPGRGIAEETGIAIPIPRDVEGAEYFFAAPVSDYIMEADTLMGIAKTFHAAGRKLDGQHGEL